MKPRRTLVVAMGVLLLIACVILLRPRNGAQAALERTRRTLRQQGFKLEFSELNLTTPPELRARAAALAVPGSFRGRLFPRGSRELMKLVGTNSARASWQQTLEQAPGGPGWPDLREDLASLQPSCDAADDILRAGPVRFEPVPGPGGTLLLSYLPAVRQLSWALALRTTLALRDGQPAEAWRNLLAVTHLAAAWQPEPPEVCHTVRFGIVALAQRATWEALQTNAWSDDQLARLQREWLAADFFGGLPETAACARADATAACRAERQQPAAAPPLGQFTSAFIRSPVAALMELSDAFQDLRNRHSATYEEERALLLFFCDRELDLRRAVQEPTWSRMRHYLSATNLVSPPGAPRGSRIQVGTNARPGGRFQGQGRSLLALAAEAETRRRLILGALALHRYHQANGAYPESLATLAPKWLPAPPIDFMDGKPLRYHRTDDGQFLLYSVGLDCEDNGGCMEEPRSPYSPGSPRGYGRQQGPDLVWPRLASPGEVELAAKAEEAAAEGGFYNVGAGPRPAAER